MTIQRTVYDKYSITWPSGQTEIVKVPTWITNPIALANKLSDCLIFLQLPAGYSMFTSNGDHNQYADGSAIILLHDSEAWKTPATVLPLSEADASKLYHLTLG